MDRIKTNSKEVNKGDTFIAIKGYNHDGHNYITDAIKRGASKVICEKGNYDIPTIIVPDTNLYLKEYLKKNYSDLFKDLKIIGVTGTNGKTTTTFLISQILTNLGINNAYIGTIGFYINSKLYKELDNTTPDTLTLYKLIKLSKEKNIKYIVMEISSHALELDRLHGIKLDCAVFTNLTEDHLDFHKTMNSYLNSKLKIIELLKDSGYLVINNDDKYAENFKFKNTINVGFNNYDFNIIKYEYVDNKTKLLFKFKNKEYQITLNFKALYNIYNYIEAVAALYSLGIKLNDIIDVSYKLNTPTGRMETILYKNNYIIIDYAHTPDALEKIITETKKCYNKKTITIIGCGGNREKEKRSIMGSIASKYSDYVIFTSDNPRNESIKDILNDMTINLRKNNFEIIEDRKKAILKALDMMDNNVILILGKGHENYQIINNKKYPFNDKQIVLDYIN